MLLQTGIKVLACEGLAMGQTYEQLDENKVGRLGERGKEDLSKIDA